ncbi:MAG: ATP-grasp domain-containing protein [Dehalococcoidia bacterium]|nr:ATP-grasp domain-containing protein [Dehalococcoidia bacterium]
MHIALVYNAPLPSRYHALGEGEAVAGVMEAVEAVRGALCSWGHTVALVGLRPPLRHAVDSLSRLRADLVFNLFEGFDGLPETEGEIAKALGLLGYPFTGASAATLALSLDKGRTKRALEAQGVPTPPWKLLSSDEVTLCVLEYPVIVKPSKEDASHGLTAQSVVGDPQALARQVRWLEEKYGGPALVERFLPGREFSATVLGGPTSRVLAPAEVVYAEATPGPKIMTYAAKWLPEAPAYRAVTIQCPAQTPPALAQEVQSLALAAHRAVGAPPYARVDLRCDDVGSLYVLEINPNPDLSPEAGVALQARVAGLEYKDLIKAIVDLALEETQVGNHYAATHAV